MEVIVVRTKEFDHHLRYHQIHLVEDLMVVRLLVGLVDLVKVNKQEVPSFVV